MPLATLTTKRLVLRPPRPEDAEAIFASYAKDPEVAHFVIWRPHRTIEDTRKFLQHFESHTEDGYPWVMTLSESGAVIGAMHLRVNAPWAEFGFNIAREHWGRGYGTEAVRSVIDFGLALPGVHRVQAMCHVDNAASARVMEKAGMMREGVLHRYMLFPNVSEEPQDVFIFAKTG